MHPPDGPTAAERQCGRRCRRCGRTCAWALLTALFAVFLSILAMVLFWKTGIAEHVLPPYRYEAMLYNVTAAQG